MITGRPPITPATSSGDRLATLRRNAGLSQRQVAEALGIPPRTISFYERQATHLPSHLVPKLSEVLDVSIDVILGVQPTTSKIGKRGPKSDLERRIEKVKALPKKQQQLAISMLDQIIGNNTAKAS